MERIKAKILKNSAQLNEEYEAIQQLLNNILQKNDEFTNEIVNQNEKDTLIQKKQCLAIVEFQDLTIKKMLEIGVDLDEFTQQNDSQFMNGDYFNTKSEISLVSPAYFTSDINVRSKSSTPESESSRLSMPLSGILENTTIKEEVNTEVLSNGLCGSSTTLVAEKNEESTPETSSTDSLMESKKSSADISSSEEVSQKVESKTKTIQEKLKSKKLMTRRDRYLQNVLRPDIPDLSFKPSNKVFESTDSYMTCPESSSSTSAQKLTDTRRKKRRSVDKGVYCASETIAYNKPPEPSVNLLCLVSHVVSPSEFYINRFDENVPVIDALSHQLAEVFDDSVSPYQDKKTAMEQLTDHCVGYVDKFTTWYRVTVTNWRLKARDYLEEQVTIFLVDYGHTCNISYKNLRELSEEFCRIPQSAIRCHLAWLYPLGSTKDNLLEIWPQRSIDYFSGLLSDSDTVYRIIYAEKLGHSWGIDIIPKKSKNHQITYGQLLLDNDMAVEIFQDHATIFKNDFFQKQVKTAQGLAGISADMSMDEKLERFHENTNDHEYNNIDQAMLRYKATDEARICKHARNGTCFKARRCKLEHGKLRPDGITTDKQCVYVSAYKELEMPEAKSTVKLRITNVVSVNTFYACLVDGQSAGLKNLIKAMNEREMIAKYKPLQIMPAEGELVIAKNWNNYWYRARVRDVYHFPQNSDETIQVFFVDLGEISDTNINELRLIVSEFLYLPFQAIYCKLYNVQAREGQDPEKAKEYSESHFLCQIFNADVINATHSTLEVLLRKEGTVEDVGEQIIDEGFGELRTGQEFPAETLLVD